MQLLDAKLSAPFLPSPFVSRQRLLEQLDEGLRRQLTLVSAPAGSGKTTLLCEWISRRRVQIAWISLGKEENDPYRFWQYLAAAINTIANEALPALSQNSTGPTMEDIEELICWIDRHIRHDFMLILDDYHIITSPEINDAVAYLLDYLPVSMHVVIATRSQPPLTIAQMRVRGQLLEVTKDDLKFTHDEAGSYLGLMGLKNLLPDEIERLNTRAEGWAAGLQIAALSLRDSDHNVLQEFLDDFSGAHYSLGEYFLEQIFHNQNHEVQEFLLSTSILERFNKPLCTAVTGNSRSGEILEQLERGNLFLVRLDDEREWHRYQHLFTDFLVNKLRQDHPEQFAILHQRAAKWFEMQGWLEAAVEHALAAGEFDLADRLIRQVEDQLWGRNEVATLGRWFSALPAEYVNSKPALCCGMAWTIALSDNLEQLLPRLARVEALCKNGEGREVAPSLPGDNSIAGQDADGWRFSAAYYQSHVYILRAYHALFQGQMQDVLRSLNHASELIPNDVHCWERVLVISYMGLYSFWNYELEQAVEMFTASAQASLNLGHHMIHIASLSNLAAIHILLGNLSRAEEYYEETFEYVAEIGREILTAGNQFGLNDIRLMRNQVDEAAMDSDRYLRLSEASGRTFDLVVAHIGNARIKHVLGNGIEAQAHLKKAHQVASCRRAYVLKEITELWQARLGVLSGDLTAAARWADHLQSHRIHVPYLNELQDLTLASFLVAEGKADEATQLLLCLRKQAEAGGRNGIVIEAMALLALAYQKNGRQDLARETLGELILRAKPEGYVRVFVELGDEMRTLFQETLKQNLRLTENGSVKEYAHKVLKAFGTPPASHAYRAKPVKGSKDDTKHDRPLIEPLSGRELQVLRLIAEGKSYEEVASDLIVALSTVQWHVKNIYQKLNVHSGMEAAAIARGMGILQ